MSRYMKRPVVVEAFFLDGISKPEYPSWWIEARKNNQIDAHLENDDVWWTIQTLEGKMKAKHGENYIVRGTKGEIYPVRVDIFEETYQKVEEIEQEDWKNSETWQKFVACFDQLKKEE